MAGRKRERVRREPSLGGAKDDAGSGCDVWITPEDRPAGAAGRKPANSGKAGGAGELRGRREPTFEPTLAPVNEPMGGSRRARARAGEDGVDQAASPADAARPGRRGSNGRVGGDGGSRKGRRRSLFGRAAYWSAVLGLWAFIGLGGIVAFHFARLPPIDRLTVPKRPPNIAIVAMDGTLLANRGDTGGRAVAIGELPPYLPKAFVAIEDRRFYEHNGIDVIGIARALLRNLTAGGLAQGGSTLSQQLAKNLFLTQERTLSRKVQEAILAVWLERKYTKDQILELYLNRVYFGSGAYGVEAAAQRYFGKSARAVTVAEAAILGGVVQAPSRLSPNRNPEAAQARAQLVLTAMAQEGFITDARAKAALMTPANIVRPQGAGSVNYAADHVMDVLDDFVGAIEQDIVVTTTLDPAMQAAAERALIDELDQKGAKFGVGQGAIVSLAPDGAIKALVGGRNYSDSQFNRATIARRQPGSAFKPFVYLTALERGLTPDTVREDGPVNIKGYQPENFSRTYAGPVTLTTALAHSLNTVAVRLGQEVTAKAVVRTAQRLGISSALQPNASIALGTSEVSPLELTAAYAAFANGGTGVIPHVIRSVRTVDGKPIYARVPTDLGRVVDTPYIGMLNGMLREAVVAGTARKADIPGWDVAGKTGTSQDFRDAWFMGYTSQLVTGIWLGNDDGTPTRRTSGSNLPVEIWNRYMKTALNGLAPRPLPGLAPRGPGSFDAGPNVATSSENPLRDPSAAYPGSRASQAGNAPQRPPGSVGAGGTPRTRTEPGFFERLFGG